MKLTTAEQMKELDRQAIEEQGIPSLDLMERPGTLICFDFQADVLRRYCGSRVRFQTIDFTKFEGRLFP